MTSLLNKNIFSQFSFYLNVFLFIPVPLRALTQLIFWQLSIGPSLLLDLKNMAFPSNIEIPMKSSCPCITKKTKRDPKTTLRAPSTVHKGFNLSQIQINFCWDSVQHLFCPRAISLPSCCFCSHPFQHSSDCSKFKCL